MQKDSICKLSWRQMKELIKKKIAPLEIIGVALELIGRVNPVINVGCILTA